MSRFNANPTQEHMEAVDHIFAYLQGTKTLALHYSREVPRPDDSFSHEGGNLHTLVDADHGGCMDTRKSTSGFVLSLAGAPISWASRRQTATAQSTCESEYIVAFEAARELVWMQNLINDLNLPGLHVQGTYV
jgi:hypothetical protein